MKNFAQTLKYFILYVGFYTLKIIGGLFPRKKSRIIFGAWLGNKYDDNPKALFEHVLENHKELQAYWLTTNNNIIAELRAKGLPAVNSRSWKGIWLCLTAKYYCFCVNEHDCKLYLFPLLNGITFVNLWHGVPLKKVGHDNNFAKERNRQQLSHYSKGAQHWIMLKEKMVADMIAKSEYHIATSSEMGKIYHGVFDADEDHVLILGQSRNDYFFNPHTNPISERFKDFEKIIVYMPTHRKEGRQEIKTAEIFDLDAINEFCKSRNIVFLVKKHFYHRNEPVIANGQYSNIVELTQEPIKTQELVDCADVLITDYSGVYIDYILLDRPMIFYAYDFEDYLKTDRTMYLPYSQEYIPGKICRTQQEMQDELAQTLEGNDSAKEIRHKMSDYYYNSETRKAVAETQINTILSL